MLALVASVPARKTARIRKHDQCGEDDDADR
jgi:hypothetical protein